MIRAGLALLALMASTRPAFAEDPASELVPRTVVGFAALDRPTGILEAGLGWLTLPGAVACQEECSRGDTSIELDVWPLYRADKRFAVGAGLMIGLIPTNADGQKHSRRYMTVEGTARYYPYVGENVEWWIGATGGLVVLSDRFVVGQTESDRALLGPQGQNIRTEAASIGIAGGPVIALGRSWAFGCTLRYGIWFLPTEPAHDVLGNQATLTGNTAMVSLGFNIALRLGL